MIIIRILLFVFFIVTGIISLYNVNVNIKMYNFYNLFMQRNLHFYIVIFLHFYYIINNVDIDSIIENKKEKYIEKINNSEKIKELEKILNQSRTKVHELEKKHYQQEYVEPRTIVINFNELIVFLLLVIIIILLWINGIFFKLKKISIDNIDEILTTSYLTEEEKMAIMTKYYFNKNEVLGKMIWELI